MSDPILDILRTLAKRQATTAGKEDGQCAIIDSAYEKNEKTNQKVEDPCLESATEVAPIPTSYSVKSAKTAETLDFDSGSKNLRTYEINEFHEKTLGCTNHPAPPAWDGAKIRIHELNEKTDPSVWDAGLALLDPDLPPADVPPKRWRQLITDCGRLSVDGVFERAAQLGWTAFDLFGCDRDRPFARIDQMGLVWLINGWRILGMSRSAAVIRTAGGAQLTYRRKAESDGQVLVWELCSGAEIAAPDPQSEIS